ncbi:MAG TPA: S8 family serine peptidase [Dehalococcoidia bacterium]|nr:S8 family serine peptidase [Dehalococcoidia bacterium]
MQLRAEEKAQEAKRIAAEAGATVERLPTPAFVTLAVKPGDEQSLIDRLREDPAVESAEVNALRFPQAIPIDDLYPRQWDMSLIDASGGWAYNRGDGVTIAVLDTGIAYEDFGAFRRAPQLSRADFVFPFDATDGSAHANDRDGHGTHVTGTLAQDWDVVGVAGLAPHAFIMPVRVCSETGCPSDAVAEGVRWAVDHGADVVNISLSGPTPTQVERDAFSYAEERGVVAVAAAGNGGSDLIGDPVLPYPARYETVISVGAINSLGQRTAYSNWGEHDGEGGLHILAPGGNTHEDLDGDSFDDGVLQETFVHRCAHAKPIDYKAFELCTLYGTSMAAPHVSGVAAMLLSEYQGLTPLEVRRVLACSAKDVVPGGDDPENGAGLVQAGDALSDSDGNGIVDCLDDPPALKVTVSDVRVLPDGLGRVSVDASVPYPGLLSYEVALNYEPLVADMASCIPRVETICEKSGPDRIAITSEPSNPVWGTFRLAHIDMRAVGNLNAFTSIQVQVQAQSARIPDIGLEVVRDDGSFRIVNPSSSRYGDLDCDNKVGPTDVLVALRGNPWPCSPIADANCDGIVDARDAIDLVAYLGNVARPQSAGCAPIGYSPLDPTPTPDPTEAPTPVDELSPAATATLAP